MTISLDEYERDRFNEFRAAAGMDPSTAFRMFVKAVLRENRIPFEISGDPFFSPVNQARVLKSMREVREGKCFQMARNYEEMNELELFEEIKKRYADPCHPRNERERITIAAELFNDKERLREVLQSDDGLIVEFCRKNGEAKD